MPNITLRHMPKRINNPQTRITPRGIILHYVGNPATSAANNARYLSNVNNRTSVHYVVDDDEIIEIIPPDMVSYGTSNGAYNGAYIQIEMCHPDSTGKITEATLANVVWLCRKLIREYGCTDIVRHYDVTGKKCPKYYVNHPDEWEKLKERILKEGEDMTYEQFAAFMERYESEARQKPVSDYAKASWDKAKQAGIMDGSAPRGSLTREQLAAVMDRLGAFEK